MDCPLCLEEMDISDLNFKPCPCGYQVSTFTFLTLSKNKSSKNQKKLNSRDPTIDLSFLLASYQREFKW